RYEERAAATSFCCADGQLLPPLRALFVTRALPRARARGEFLAFFRIAHLPAQRGNLITQFIASFPMFFASRVLPLLSQLRHFGRYCDLRLAFEFENSVDSAPPIEPCVCRRAV